MELFLQNLKLGPTRVPHFDLDFQMLKRVSRTAVRWHIVLDARQEDNIFTRNWL